jgi:hypothetical protein
MNQVDLDLSPDLGFIPQSEPWEPMSEFSDDPISLYAQSELDVCYANDPFYIDGSRQPTEETLESFNAE